MSARELWRLGGTIMTEKKREWARDCLKRKSEELGRLPKKEDFDGPTRSRIKAFLGPWPRALEEAGLKEKKKKEKDSRDGAHNPTETERSPNPPPPTERSGDSAGPCPPSQTRRKES